MKFGTLDELVRYIISENINLKFSEVEFKTSLIESEVIPLVNETKIPPRVKLTSLNNLTEMEAGLGDDNILYVDSYEAVKDYCGTGKINAFGKTLVVNMCEMDNTAHTSLSIDIDGKSNYNVDFKLRLLSEKAEGEPLIQIKETLLDESISNT